MSAWDNLKANASQNNLLSQDGMFRQNDYWRLWLESQKALNPSVGAVLDTGSKAFNGGYNSSDNFSSNVPSKPASEAQAYYDYWKDDGISGRDLAQVGGAITGVPISSLTDYAMGKNPAGNIGSWLGQTMLSRYATSPETYMALSNAGGMAGQWGGEQVSPGQWSGYNPGRSTSEALGFKEGSRAFDATRDISMDIISEKVNQGMTVDEAVAEFDKEARENQNYTGPVTVEEKSTGYGMQGIGESAVEDYKAGSITAIEPTSVNDFVGMFSGAINDITGGISNYFNTPANTSSPLAPQTYAQRMSNAYGAESDPYSRGYEAFGQEGDATSRDASGTTWHSKDYNWNSTDGGASDVGSSSGPAEGTDANDEASANSDGGWD